ncbi:MAG: type II toxin-antitoxin system RelE/ParE family toxin [Rickettsiales bacterium]|nr:type II toxin-antitoxin system RelE/ParE family toxin [Rickettsiales bacterium]
MSKKIDYTISDKADEEIESIYLRIAEFNRQSANNLVEKFVYIFETLTIFPFLGRSKPEFTNKDCLWINIEGYWVAYKYKKNNIEILRVLSSYMDIPNRFNN